VGDSGHINCYNTNAWNACIGCLEGRGGPICTPPPVVDTGINVIPDNKKFKKGGSAGFPHRVAHPASLPSCANLGFFVDPGPWIGWSSSGTLEMQQKGVSRSFGFDIALERDGVSSTVMNLLLDEHEQNVGTTSSSDTALEWNNGRSTNGRQSSKGLEWSTAMARC